MERCIAREGREGARRACRTSMNGIPNDVIKKKNACKEECDECNSPHGCVSFCLLSLLKCVCLRPTAMDFRVARDVLDAMIFALASVGDVVLCLRKDAASGRSAVGLGRAPVSVMPHVAQRVRRCIHRPGLRKPHPEGPAHSVRWRAYRAIRLFHTRRRQHSCSRAVLRRRRRAR